MRVELPGIEHWRHDLGHCLQTTAGVLLGFHGADPIDVLGAGWGFGYRAGDVRREEYYFPCLRGSLFASIAPHHPITSTWHEPADAEQGWQEVRAAVAAGQPVAVAADNYHLPFRPAYRDVHTNHLLVVYGFDDERGVALVIDSVPPRFQGEITIAELTAARDSANPVVHDRDMFFTARPIGNRWLEVGVEHPLPKLDRDRLSAVLTANVAGYAGDGDGGREYHGLPGLRRFLTDSAARLADGDPAVVDEVFVVGGTALAVSGLHGDHLAAAARRFAEPALAELAREVDRIAHHWSAVRIIVAAGREDPGAAARGLATRTTALLADYTRTLNRMSRFA